MLMLPLMLHRARRRPPRSSNTLIEMRALHLPTVEALFLFLILLPFIVPWSGPGGAGWFPLLVIANGLYSLGMVRWLGSKSLTTTTLDSLANSFRGFFHLGLGTAASAALIGFAGVFFTNKPWVFLIGLPFGLAGLILIAPTKGAIERGQQQLMAQGSPLYLLEALTFAPKDNVDAGQFGVDSARPGDGSATGTATARDTLEGKLVAKRRSDFGTLYKGREGQWSWVAHRVTGVAIILFLFAHVVDTAVVGWGPDAYNRVLSVYHNWAVRILELGLVAAVLYHALNGLKIMIIDFWPGATGHHKPLLYGTTAVFLASMAPITYLMGRDILKLALHWNL